MSYQIERPVLHDITMACRAQQDENLAHGLAAQPDHPDDLWLQLLMAKMIVLMDQRIKVLHQQITSEEARQAFYKALVEAAGLLVGWIESYNRISAQQQGVEVAPPLPPGFVNMEMIPANGD